MNKKGFTLIELIGVIVLISLMVLIIAPTINRVIKQGQASSDKQLEENILLAARNWATDNKGQLKVLEKGWTRYITLKELQDGGYIDKDIKLPSTGENYDNRICVKITNVSSTNKQVLEYKKVTGDKCENTITNVAVKIIGTTSDNSNFPSNVWTNKNVTLHAVDVKTSNTPSGSNYSYQWRENIENKTTTSTVNTKKLKVSSGEIEINKYQVRMNVGGADYTAYSTPEYIVKIDKKKPVVTTTRNETKPHRNNIKITLNEGSNESGLITNQTIYYGFSTSKENPPTQYYSIKTNSTNKTTQEVTINSDNSIIGSLQTNKYYIWIKEGIKDNAGNLSKNFVSETNYLIDNTAPACSISRPAENGDSGWYKEHNVSLSLSTWDTTSNPNSGVYKYGLTTNTTPTYNNSTSDSQGNTPGITWYGYVMDNAGNTNNCNSGSFKVDTTPPSCSISTSGTSGDNDWYKEKPMQLAISPSDSGPSGLSVFGLTPSSSTTYNNTRTDSQSDTGPTKVTWHGYVKDVAGNINDCKSISFRVDTKKPECTTSQSGTISGVEGWTNKNITVKATCKDEDGGSTCATEPFTHKYDYDIKTTKAGAKGDNSGGTVKDKAGNLTNCPADQTVKRDTTKPTCTVSGGNSTWINKNSSKQSRTIKAHCTDTEGTVNSGCNTDDFSKEYSSNIDTTTAGAKGDGEGGSVEDKAGNKRNCAANRTVKIDKNKPTCEATKGGRRTDGVHVTVKCTDSGPSGCVNTSETKTGVTSTTSYTVKDNAGNESTNNCKVTVSSKYYYRSRTCSAHNSCDHGYWSTCYTTSYYSASCDCSGDTTGCYNAYSGCTYTGRSQDKICYYSCPTTSSYSCWQSNYYVANDCSCNTWGSWSGYDATSCSTDNPDHKQCQSKLYYE